MLDLDSQSGKQSAQKFLDSIAKLIERLGSELEPRLYRMNYSQTYRRMMPEHQAYQADILDTAQEASPHMWVNGEKYVFSEHVVDKGVDLFK
jgi:gamma-glutamyl-gamma-aminobutyrate hydrolase PuuD